MEHNHVPRRFEQCQQKYACLRIFACVFISDCLTCWDLCKQLCYKMKNTYKGECKLFIRTCHHIACSVYDLIQPLSFSLFPLPAVCVIGLSAKHTCTLFGWLPHPYLASRSLNLEYGSFALLPKRKIHNNLKLQDSTLRLQKKKKRCI